MEFRAPSVAKEQNEDTVEYFTQHLADPEMGRKQVEMLIEEMGNAVGSFPDWHPVLTLPQRKENEHITSISQLKIYLENGHTRNFVRGFVTCPYSEESADTLLSNVNKVWGLSAKRLEYPLYADNAYPVVVTADAIELEADGTVRSRDAIRWFAQLTIKEAEHASVAETWWNIRSLILGCPHGSRSSLFVNQYAGQHMRKILEALNKSGIFGPVKETSLEMLSQAKRDKICETLLRAAVNKWDKKSDQFEFELRGEKCVANIRDTWKDDFELSIRIKIGKSDLYLTGFYYPAEDRITFTEPRGKKALAEKFI